MKEKTRKNNISNLQRIAAVLEWAAWMKAGGSKRSKV